MPRSFSNHSDLVDGDFFDNVFEQRGTKNLQFWLNLFITIYDLLSATLSLNLFSWQSTIALVFCFKYRTLHHHYSHGLAY